MNKVFIIVSIMLIASELQGQHRQYVVKTNNDTIYGKLMINPIRDNSRYMYFKSANGERMRIRPLRTTYVYYNDKYQFRSVIFLQQRLFMQIIREDDKLSLYNYIHRRDNNLVTSRVAVKNTGEALELSVLNFKNQMKDFLKECPQLVAKLDAKAYKFKNHQALFAEYNECDLLQYTASSAINAQVQNPQNPPAVAVEKSSGNTADAEITRKSDIQQLRLQKLEQFESYVSGLTNFQFKSDVLELVTDLANRVNQNSEIPAYLWSTLEAMVQDDADLKEKTQQLKLDIR